MDSPLDPPEQSETAPTGIPWMRARQLVRHAVSYETAWKMSDSFVNHVPRAIQRRTERLADYPIAAHVRAAPVLLVRVPKSASLSLSKQIYGRVTHVPHRTALFYRTSDPQFFSAITSFAVVRNPWERSLSAYAYLKRGGDHLSRPNPQVSRRMESLPTFEHFVHDYLVPQKGSLHRLDPTVHAQHTYVCDGSAKIIVDHVFRFERLDEVQGFLMAHGVAPREHHLNRSVGDASPRSMSRTVAAEIGRLYEVDVAMFAYYDADPS